jgi:aromatic-L-amino-acid/L-tryptophan decarboxylase
MTPARQNPASPAAEATAPTLGDMDAATFRRVGHELVEWIATYLESSDRYPVLSQIRPGEIREALPESAPARGEPFDDIVSDFERVILPGVTHWNHPGFFAYFAISSSGPGVLAEFLSAALNQQAMLWRTSPAATELEEVTLGWLRELMGLPALFEGIIYDTASISSLHALAAARELAVPDVGTRGLRESLPLRVYCSDQTHNSVDKAIRLLGLGQDAIARVATDAEFRMRPEALVASIKADRAAGRLPMAVVATVGSTSATAIDPISALADVCEAEGVWLHVDAAYGGVAAMVPGREWIFDGVARADSMVVNPHKWLFTPFDLSALYTRRMDVLRRAFALSLDILETPERERGRNLMDTGIQLGRRFRALKLWMVLRYFGADGIRARLAEHMRLARLLADWVDADTAFERLAPVPLSTVCFRATPSRLDGDEAALDRLNATLEERVNQSGRVFISHTRLNGRYALRVAIGHIRTTEVHVAEAWRVIRDELAALT